MKKITLLIAILASLSMCLTSNKEASALSASDFNPGYIIDDAVFYNANAMNESQIQSFLNSKLPTCDTNGTGRASDKGRGDITRAQYAALQNNPSVWHKPPYTCLKNFKQNTPQVEAASTLCSSIPAGTNRSAAQIINTVAKACNINPQVLLVLLEKEQSLVTDNWPLNLQYTRATGFACPDNVGGVCDPKFNGFFSQVYAAARQYNVYKVRPLDYNYIAGRTNNIYWQTNQGEFVSNGNASSRVNGRCGYSRVYIQNQATAALYIYTPYRPNQAAMNALNFSTGGAGNGDACSAYGNRNFWFLFNRWFGSSVYTIKGSIGNIYRSGTNSNTLGDPVENEKNTVNNGWKQCFEKGCIIGSSKTGYWIVKGSIKDRLLSTANLINRLGLPVENEANLGGGVWQQRFQNGYISGKKASGYWEIIGSIGNKYKSSLVRSSMGIPIGKEVNLGDGVWYQSFLNGSIAGSNKTNYWTLDNNVFDFWFNDRKIFNTLGLPIKEKFKIDEGINKYSFQNGLIMEKLNNFILVKGSIHKKYLELGEELSKIGLPIENEANLGGGVWQQRFQNGYISGKNGTYNESRGAIRDYWISIGRELGFMGSPISPIHSDNSASWQHYTGGSIILNLKNNEAWESRGSIRKEWASSGYQNGPLGFPTGPERLINKVWKQDYEHGQIVSTNGTAKTLVY